MTAGPGLKQIFEETAFLYGGNATYIESLQDRFDSDPASVPESWRDFFRLVDDDVHAVRQLARGPTWRPRSAPVAAPPAGAASTPAPGQAAEPPNGGTTSAAEALPDARASARALAMIHAYRVRGHLLADLDPLGLRPPRDHADLRPATYGFTEADGGQTIFVDGALGCERATLDEIVARLRATYCGTTGYEFMHISDPEPKAWLQARIEGPEAAAPLTPKARRAILETLVEVKGYERYLDKKFVGTKRFGLDGAEAAIPALEEILAAAAGVGVEDVVIGMAHRGRLNVLSQVLMKPHRAIFHEFQGGSFVPDEVEGSGDVKYHLGASSDRTFGERRLHISLTANPSHLEIVDPVCLGKVRAKQDQAGDTAARSAAMALLIHGDAAVAGQGVVAECFGLSGLAGHTTGGSLHLIINNQIGFTTDPAQGRSSPYPSDVAKMIEAPIFHVNGDDPEAVVRAARLAVEFRQTFHTPVVIDMFCFRLYGHNEGDEPAFTQPVMYKAIRAHPSTLEIYADRLTAEGLVTADEVAQASADWVAHLDTELEASKSYVAGKADWLDARWSGLTVAGDAADDARKGETAVPLERLQAIGARLTDVPEGFRLHPTVRRFLDNRRAALEAGNGIDWSTAEALALGSLVDEGVPVRLSGQDSERGTFTQRHAVLSDQQSGARHTPLTLIRDGQARCEIVNSMLSEEAVLGFEYGYSLAEPNALVMWEAQFGDFANGAQVVFDQFLSSGERKWLRMSGLVCLLPHGYDGQGPEHSSARLERYLQNSAEDNWQVANCTTPANYFHVLRRQVRRDFRKPLILMTPKSLLRHKRAVSSLAELGPGSAFRRLLPDSAEGVGLGLAADADIRRVILCSGKVYYDLLDAREKRGGNGIYLLRVEQLYPFPLKALAAELARFPAADVVWAQEEPRNMGAWTFVEPLLRRALSHVGGATREARYAGRPAAASTAVGAMPLHQAQLETLLQDAFKA